MTPITQRTNIIDSHVHFWHPDQVYVSWIKQDNKAFFKHKDAHEYTEQIEKSDVYIQSAVYVETDVDACHGLVEADWIVRYADQIQSNAVFGGIGAIVVFAPVYQGNHVRNYLDTLIHLLRDKQSYVKGVRYLLQDPTQDPHRVLSPEFVQGIQALEAYHLSFDLTINCNDHPEQFPPLQTLVSLCPRVRFVLDHMGKPPCDSQPGEKRFEFWRQQIHQLAQFPHVYCKVSGLLTEFKENHDDVAKQLKPFIQVIRDSFGVDRIMFGGDWPIVELSHSNWQQWYQILSDIIQDWSAEEKNKLFVINAAHFYQL
ncbi:uncharacterized protein B0P05DRAFT_251005 [Gilbertella persicaria]|uniref:Amidohydrolase-related domain-containing protein n=1 Tax=Rhizopus stolonifer TaxID=4846 RepID=A0A367KIY8_RHIST|nr:uncharacterized protein B0P05DRAFT_251005 [Gilbertella persicaria]KAI8061499.1 hypothetical protein B0P05DRAFT_251005 [Gilbertella persicaria]RCI02137.1 hypothetical protein CU098_004444 [Rhizopus stolonifer]